MHVPFARMPAAAPTANFGAAELAPAVATTQRAQYYRWMLFCANTLMPACRAWFYADEIAGPENAEASRLHARLKLERAWQQVADHLEAHGPYLLGAQRSAADSPDSRPCFGARVCLQQLVVGLVEIEIQRRSASRPTLRTRARLSALAVALLLTSRLMSRMTSYAENRFFSVL